MLAGARARRVTQDMNAIKELIAHMRVFLDSFLMNPGVLFDHLKRRGALSSASDTKEDL